MVAMPPVPTPEQLDRRAQLLAECGSDDAAELARLTDQLGSVMRGDDLVVTRLDASEQPALARRLADAEQVHPVRDAADLADRLAEDRRCYVLHHPDLPDRPFNVVWVALWRGVPDDLSAILDPEAPTEDPRTADTAAFYSIWTAEPGTVGLPGGRRLLLGAVDALRTELPGLGCFVTLSPIPGFRSWLEASDLAVPEGEALSVACARYLTTLRDDGRPVDPVARFHLGNGARLLALAPHGDRSERGLERSFGIMANYRYEPEDRAANRAELRAGRPAVGTRVAALLD